MRIVVVSEELCKQMGRIFEGHESRSQHAPSFSPDGYHAEDYLWQLLRAVEERRKTDSDFNEWLGKVAVGARNHIDYSQKLDSRNAIDD